MADWLVGLAQMIPVAGSYLSSAIQSAREQKPDENLAQKVVKDWGTGLAGGFGEVGGRSIQAAGTAFQYASDKDPSQLLTQPVTTGLHAVGLGQEGDDWDKGLLGITGTAFDKIGRLATFVTLWSDAAYQQATDPIDTGGINLRKRAWDMAFESGGEAVRFGEAILADNRSILVDPSGLEKARKQIEGTWYGNVATGVLDFAMYSALDPTRGVARTANAARADKFIPDAATADRLAGVLNKDLLPETALAGEQIAGGLGQRIGQVAKVAAGGALDDASVVGNQWKAMGALDDVTDLNQIINHLDPMLGIGGSTPRSGIPVVAEMFRDAARITDDITLQRQIKLNVQYALTGSEEAMNWLVQNFPQVAAKGRRVQFAPSEFTLLDDAMADFAAKGNTAFGLGGQPGRFNLGDWITRHYDDPWQQRELAAYGQQVERIQRFKAQIWGGGPGGQAIEFGTEAGVQIAPRNLEKLKSFMNNRVMDEWVFQDGPSGRTMRILGDSVLPTLRASAGDHGFISVIDPVHGARQLGTSLKQYSKQVDGVDGAYIKTVTEEYLKLDPAGRTAYVRQLNDDLLRRVAAKHGMTSDQLDELIAMTSQAYIDGREYASKLAKQQAARGNPNAYLGDLGGTDTVLGAAHLQSHLDETVGIFDWRTADRVARDWKTQSSLRKYAGGTKDASLKTVLAYQTAWKHAQLGRPGLAVRVMLDTDLRANAMIGTSALMMQAFTGAANKVRNVKGKKYGTVRSIAVSDVDRMNAERAAATAAELRGLAKTRAEKMALRQTEAYRADELAESLMAKVSDESGKLRGKDSIMYARLSQRAKDLANRKAGDTYTVGRTAPLGQQALRKEQMSLGPAELQAARAQELAAEHYLSGSARTTAANSFKSFDVEADGVSATFRPVHTDLEWATLEDDVRDSASGLSELLLGNMDQNLWRARVEKGHWADDVDPDSPLWPQKYAKSVQQFRESYTARRLLVEGDAVSDATPDSIFQSFINDKAVVAEFRDVMGGGSREEMARWLSDMLTSVRSMAPNAKLRERLMQEKVLTPDEVMDLIPAGERFPIFAPNIVRDSAELKAMAKRGMDLWYKTFTDMPDVYLGRIPVYNALYRRAVDQVFPAVARKAAAEGRKTLTADEMAMVHSRAKQRALNAVHRDMYDIHRQIGAHGVMRYIAPFFAPWYDSMTSWGRLLYDDPSRFGQLMRYSQTPDMFGITVDKDGRDVRPWDNTPISEKFIRVPLAGVGGVEHFRLGFASLNVVAQGNNPFSPGVGPLAQLAGTAVVGHVLPQVAPDAWEWMAKNPDNMISQQLFAGGGEVPRGTLKDLAGGQMPSYMRQFSDVLLGENGFGNTYINAYGTRLNDLIIKFREENGGRDPNEQELRVIQREAESGGKAAAFTRSIISFGIGMSGTSSPEGQYYVDRMHALVQATPALKQMGLTPEQVFAANYPQAANLNWSFSVNEGRLEASVTATTAFNRYRTLMEQNPDIMWWIAGPDNISGQFSQSAYNQQITSALRRKLSQEELNQRAQIEMAWGKINQFNTALQLYMRQNGIKSLSDSNAGDLSGLRRQYMDKIAADYPEWTRSMASRDVRKERQSNINQIAELVENGPASLRSQPYVKLTAQYLAAREQVIAEAAAQGIAGWESSKALLPQRRALYLYGQSLAKDPTFAAAWSRLFEREFNDDTVESISITQTGP